MNRLDAATYGLALCFLVHDTEELLTYRTSSEASGGVVGLRGWSQDHVNVAISLIGLHWVGAALDGRRTSGRSAWFQNALLAWGVHGLGHLAVSVATRRYLSGTATAPLVVGYWLWARKVLREEGVPIRATAGGALLSLPALVAAHAGAEAIVRRLARPSVSSSDARVRSAV